MEKLNIDALKERADEIATEELMSQISGGTENACHDVPDYEIELPDTTTPIDNTGVGTGGNDQ